MKRCTCGKPNCRLEYLYDTDPKFRSTWDSMADPPAPSSEECKGCDKPKSPGIVTKARNFKTAFDRWVEAGRPLTPDDEFEKRREICNGCDKLDKKADRCLECGCPLEKANWMARLLTDSPGKLRMKTEACPLGKW